MERRDALKKVVYIGGTAILTPTLLSLLQSCQRQPRIDWQPVFFTTEQAEFISVLVDTLLPKTQTPGALEMKVDIFIDRVVKELYDESGQKKLVEGLGKFEAGCEDKFGSKFAALKENERVEILKAEEKASGKYNGKVWGTAVNVQQPVGFYRTIKSMALWGYFSSEEIGKNHLNYDPIPGPYMGCIPLSDVGNTWSL